MVETNLVRQVSSDITIAKELLKEKQYEDRNTFLG
jgi:hypothetical protein